MCRPNIATSSFMFAGMKCGGCVGHVKKILEEQPGVTSASVNLATETALVRVLVPRGSRQQPSGSSGNGGSGGGGALAALGEKLAQVRVLGQGRRRGKGRGFQARLRRRGQERKAVGASDAAG